MTRSADALKARKRREGRNVRCEHAKNARDGPPDDPRAVRTMVPARRSGANFAKSCEGAPWFGGHLFLGGSSGVTSGAVAEVRTYEVNRVHGR